MGTMPNKRRVILASAACAALFITVGLVTASFAQAVPLPALIAACRGGDGPSCHHAGMAYKMGQIVPQDLRRALHHFERGCRLGVPDSCVEGGNIFSLRNPRRAHQMYRRGLRLYQTACAGGNAQACQNAAQLTATLRGM
jgi:TPR repeat protein